MHNNNPQELIKTLRYLLEEAEKGLESGKNAKYDYYLTNIYSLLNNVFTEKQQQGGNKWLM
ncbi:hypothetical protein M3703_07130 [Mannheimia haemolytica]|uniref:hypothetical protein n=1 Tax=Mannheimia haemolytica TaxID=75985 RepID=UPI00201C382D|nr:hypothetical protein [Mannheimia haemolytica]UQX78657.1 hypothetical protein M3703_07130 [Mannheimia haemolytica]